MHIHVGADRVFTSFDYAEHDAVPEVVEVTVVRDKSPDKTQELASIFF